MSTHLRPLVRLPSLAIMLCVLPLAIAGCGTPSRALVLRDRVRAAEERKAEALRTGERRTEWAKIADKGDSQRARLSLCLDWAGTGGSMGPAWPPMREKCIQDARVLWADPSSSQEVRSLVQRWATMADDAELTRELRPVAPPPPHVEPATPAVAAPVGAAKTSTSDHNAEVSAAPAPVLETSDLSTPAASASGFQLDGLFIGGSAGAGLAVHLGYATPSMTISFAPSFSLDASSYAVGLSVTPRFYFGPRGPVSPYLRPEVGFVVAGPLSGEALVGALIAAAGGVEVALNPHVGLVGEVGLSLKVRSPSPSAALLGGIGIVFRP